MHEIGKGVDDTLLLVKGKSLTENQCTSGEDDFERWGSDWAVSH